MFVFLYFLLLPRLFLHFASPDLDIRIHKLSPAIHPRHRTTTSIPDKSAKPPEHIQRWHFLTTFFFKPFLSTTSARRDRQRKVVIAVGAWLGSLFCHLHSKRDHAGAIKAVFLRHIMCFLFIFLDDPWLEGTVLHTFWFIITPSLPPPLPVSLQVLSHRIAGHTWSISTSLCSLLLSSRCSLFLLPPPALSLSFPLLSVSLSLLICTPIPYIALRLYLIVKTAPFIGCRLLAEKGAGRERGRWRWRGRRRRRSQCTVYLPRRCCQEELQRSLFQQTPRNHMFTLRKQSPCRDSSNYDGSKGGSRVTLL